MLTIGTAAPSGPRAAGTADLIAFSVRVRGFSRIYTIRPDGTGLRVLTRLPKGLTRGWQQGSPDGRWIAFTRNIPHRGRDRVRLYVIRSDGTGLRRLTDGAPLRVPRANVRGRDVFDTMPTWSPDGRWIAFVRATAPSATLSFLFRVWLDGGAPAQLTHGYVFDFAPAWGPDGKRIGFAHEFPRPSLRPLSHRYPQLVFLQIGTSRLVGSPTTYGTDFSWSPTGARLAFASFQDANGRTCFAHANLNRYVLGLDPFSPSAPRRCLPAGEIYTTNGDGTTGLGRLTSSKADDRPLWAPDGKQIVFSSGYHDGRRHRPCLYLIPAGGGRARLLYAPGVGEALDPAWSPRPSS